MQQILSHQLAKATDSTSSFITLKPIFLPPVSLHICMYLLSKVNKREVEDILDRIF